MKLSIIIFSFIPVMSFATEPRVLSGQTQHVVSPDGSEESFVTELKLNSCNINANVTSNTEDSSISITFSNREFEAKGFSMKSNPNGTCTLTLIKGKRVR